MRLWIEVLKGKSRNDAPVFRPLEGHPPPGSEAGTYSRVRERSESMLSGENGF